MKISKAEIEYTLLVSNREIESGDILATDCFSRNDQKVASEGDEVNEKLKRQMDNMGVRKAWLQRRIPEWMSQAEAKIRNYEILETQDVSPVHYQILVNFQGAFSTDGIEQLLDRIREADHDIEDEKLQETLENLSKTVDRLKRREEKLMTKLDELEDEKLRERYYQVLSAAQPQAIDPSSIKQGKAALGRKIQGFLEELNDLKNELSDIILGMNENELIEFFELENLKNYEESPDFADSFVLFERMFDQTEHEEDPSIEELFTISRELIQEMFYDRTLNEQKLDTVTKLLWDGFFPDLPHWFMSLGQPGELNSYLLAHGVNTAILLSQLYEHADRDPEHSPQELTLACLVKDIGMVLVPQSYHLHQEDLSEEQRHKLKVHPLISREFLEDVSEQFNGAAKLIEHHHEKLDGSGYPRRVENLGPDQRLLNICDMFDAMTSPRTWRTAIPPNDAMKYLRQDAGESIDKDWVNHLIRTIGIFPVGTVVRLSNEEPSVVVQQNDSRPDKPFVIPVQQLMQSNGELQIMDLESTDFSVQAGGTSRKAPLAIRKKILQNDQISSRFISPT